MKNFLSKTGGFFKKIGLWFKNHVPTRRRIIQLYAALLTNANIKGLFNGIIYGGATKNVCVPGLNCYSCPSTVASCPLGALQNALAGSGTKTPVYILGILALFGVMLGRTICGFLCPTGLIQDLLYKIKTPKFGKNRITRILSYFKYVLLIALVVAVPLAYMLQSTPVPGFCKYICPSGTLGGAILLLLNPANASYYGMLGGLFTWKFAVLVVILLASVFTYRPFCRFVCPLGAIYGFFNKIALLGVKVEQDKCTNCGLCVAHCKMDIKKVGDHECINCGECIKVCPTKAIVWKGSSIFVKPSQLDDESTVKVPLTNFVQPAPAGAAAATTDSTTIVGDMADMIAIEGSPANLSAPAAAANAAPMRKVPRLYINEKGKKILQIVACALAGILLVGAIVYYNFFDDSARDRITTGNQIGDTCPDFTIPLLEGNDGEMFSVSDTRGKITILNFWGTWCGPCVRELPEFEEIANDYAEYVTVVAIGDYFEDVETIKSFIASDSVDSDNPYFAGKVDWSDWKVVFAHDVAQSDGNSVYTLLGGVNEYPRTVILNEDGIITYNDGVPVTYEELQEEIEKILNAENDIEETA